VKILRDYIEGEKWLPITLNDDNTLRKNWGRLFETDSAWVAEIDTKVVGFCERDHDGNNIGALYVVPEARNNGIGKGLLDAAKENCEIIIVWAYEVNKEARRFYQREGLVEFDREVDEDTSLVNVGHIWQSSDA